MAMVIKHPTLNNFLTVHLKLQSTSMYLLLQSSITAMQLMGKKDLKTFLLNKYVLNYCSESPHNIKFSAIKLLGPTEESS